MFALKLMLEGEILCPRAWRGKKQTSFPLYLKFNISSDGFPHGVVIDFHFGFSNPSIS